MPAVPGSYFPSLGNTIDAVAHIVVDSDDDNEKDAQIARVIEQVGLAVALVLLLLLLVLALCTCAAFALERRRMQMQPHNPALSSSSTPSRTSFFAPGRDPSPHTRTRHPSILPRGRPPNAPASAPPTQHDTRGVHAHLLLLLLLPPPPVDRSVAPYSCRTAPIEKSLYGATDVLKSPPLSPTVLMTEE